ncbi:MAG: DUF2490 domain-containing protein [Pontiellaceae bacterium]|nr:DUF2490 domain-containing protein [Pontiellaceae bacterium]MBN2786658.1 DUF2490 domain-containing protein [Pontiellaceae bacterium]
MKHKIKRTIMTALFITTAAASAWDASENTLWIDGSVSGKMAENLTLKLTEQLRYKDDSNLYNYHHTDVCTTYALSKAWKLSAGFRHISTRKSESADWCDKEMIHINAINKLSFAGMDFQTRMRFCYTDAENTDYLMDARPEFCLMPTKGFTGWKLKPYVSDEIMYNLNEDHQYRNRVSTGLMLVPLKALSLKAFVMHENTQKTIACDFNENFNYGFFVGYKF